MSGLHDLWKWTDPPEEVTVKIIAIKLGLNTVDQLPVEL
jgi:hypothetical protein